MKTWLLHNIGLKLFSVALATMFWFLINDLKESSRGDFLKSPSIPKKLLLP